MRTIVALPGNTFVIVQGEDPNLPEQPAPCARLTCGSRRSGDCWHYG